jgi:hypothetical protein
MGAARRTEGVLMTLAALVPVAMAAAQARNVPDAGCDASVVRVLGLEPYVGRGLDTAIELLLQAVPVGTRAARAALGGAIVAAATAAVLYAIVSTLLEACAPTRRLGPAVAAIATVMPLVGASWQAECSSVGGSATGALLVLVPLCLLGARKADEGRSLPGPVGAGGLRAAVFVLGLAAGYGLLVGACALAGALTITVVDGDGRRRLAAIRHPVSLGLAFAAGLVPCACEVARARGAGVSAAHVWRAEWSGEGVGLSVHSPVAILWTQLGPAMLLFAAGGLALAAVVARARPLASALLAVTVVGLASDRLLPGSPSRCSAPLLASLAAVCALAGAGMQALVRVVANARLPMARASAAMVLLLELVLPVDAADETLARPAVGGAVAAWDDVAWGELPPSSVVLLSSDAAWQRATAARARGSLRADVTVIPVMAPGSRSIARTALASDPALLPLWRDLEITGAPSEASLAAVAATQPLSMSYEPRWGRVLGGHLVPDGLFDRFELEPRGASDRRSALAAFSPRRDRLARLARGDAAIEEETARLLRARALLIATLDARDADAIAGAISDVRAFAPDDPMAAQLVARLAAKGPPHLDDLRP